MTNFENARKSTVKPTRPVPRASRAQVASHAPEALITYRVSVLAQALSRLVDASVQARLGLSSRQWRVLVMLNRLGTATSGEVARSAHFDHSQVSRVAFELAQRGLIVQQDHAADRRKQMLTLTAAGIECLREGIPDSQHRQAQLKARLTDDEYETFCRALAVLGDEAGRLLSEVRN